MQQENSGFSHDSSSGSSESSKRGTVDEYTLRIAADPVPATVLKNVAQFVIPYLIFPVVDMLSFALILRYTNIQSVVGIVAPLFLASLVARGIPNAIAQGTSTLTMRNIAKNQILAANIYFAHFFLLMAVYVIIVIILYLVVLTDMIDAAARQYALCNILVGTIANMFSYAVFPFLTQESRFLPVFSMCIIFICVFQYVSVSLYQSTFVGQPSQLQISVALAVAFIANLVIGFIVVTKIPFLSIKYAGTLKFSLKRLSPIRAKVIGQIVLNAGVFLFVNVADDVITIIVLYLTSQKYQDSTQRVVSMMQMVIFRFYSRVLEAVSRGVVDCFSYIAGYNIGMKKIARIYKIITFSAMLQVAACAVVGAALLIAVPWITRLFMPFTEPAILVDLLEERTKFAAYAGSWSQFLAMPAYIALALLQMEQKTFVAFLASIPKFAFALVFTIVHFFLNPQVGNLEFSLALSEMLSFLIGASCLVFYIVKYQKLFKINTQTEHKLKNTNDISMDIRESVMAELGKNAEDDDDEHREKCGTRANSIFNKQIALKGSRNFMTLRQSIGCENSAVSSINEERISVIRASQINRESIMK